MAIRLRRGISEPRIEIMPMIDVIFLLLTFFIYAMVLMVRVDLLPVKLGELTAASPAVAGSAVTITLRLDGSIYLGREAIEINDIRARLDEAKATDPSTAIYLVLEDGQAEVDRAPIWRDLWDRVVDAGMDISLVGPPKDGG